MSVTPTNDVGRTIDRFRSMIARSSTFQGWTGTDSEAAALERVGAHRIATFQRPFSLVMSGPGTTWQRRSRGTRDHLMISQMNLYVAFEALTPEVYAGDESLADAITYFENYVFAVMDEVQALAGGSEGELFLQSISLDLPTERSLDYEGDEEDFMAVRFLVVVG